MSTAKKTTKKTPARPKAPARKSAPKNNRGIIVAILVGSAFIAAAMIYLGMQMRGGADLSAQIEQGIKDYVAKQQAAANQPPEPVDVSTDDDAVKGDPNAPVTIIEFSDYECPFCKRFYENTLPQIDEKYIKTGKAKLVYRDFPLNFHQNAMPAAIAAECVRDQGGDEAYFKYHDIIFDNSPNIGPDNLKAWGRQLGFNIDECLDNEAFKDEVQKDFLDGQKAGVRGTPAFFINGRMISGAQPYAVFEQAIEEALKEAKK